MGVYNNLKVSTVDITQRATLAAAFLNDFDGITAEVYEYEYESNTFVGVHFSFDGTNIEGFYGYRAGSSYSCGWYRNGDIYYINPFQEGRGDEAPGYDYIVHAYSDSHCKLISLKDNGRWRSGIEVMAVTDTPSNELVGYYKYPTNYDTFVDISSLTFEKIDDPVRLPLAYTNMFPYSAPAGTLDFLAKSYFVNNGIRRYSSELMKECSTVSLLSTVSLPYPLNNHLAIGAHCIVPLDNEGGE